MKKIIINSVILLMVISFGKVFTGCVDFFNNCYEETKWIIVYNKHKDPYKLLIDDKFIAVVEAHDSIVHNIDYGYYNFKFIQESGFDSIPAVFEDNLNIDSCTWNDWEP